MSRQIELEDNTLMKRRVEFSSSPDSDESLDKDYVEDSLLQNTLIDNSILTIEDVTTVGRSGQKVLACKSTPKTNYETLKLSTRNILNFIVHDAKKNKTQSCISICGLFVIIGSISLILSIWALLPVIFTRTVENVVGEFDFLMLPSGESLNSLSNLDTWLNNTRTTGIASMIGGAFLNQTYIQEVLEDLELTHLDGNGLKSGEPSSKDTARAGNAFSRLLIPANCSASIKTNKLTIFPSIKFIS